LHPWIDDEALRTRAGGDNETIGAPRAGGKALYKH